MGNMGSQRLSDALLEAAHTYHARHASFEQERRYHQFSEQLAKGIGDPATAIRRYLVEWGSMGRVFREDDWRAAQDSLREWLDSRASLIKRMDRLSLARVDLKDRATEVCDLFYSLRWLPQRKASTRHRTFGPTAAGKVLHLLLPKLFVIWDGAVVRGPLDLDEDAWSYLCYLRTQQRVLRRLLVAVGSSAPRDERSGLSQIQKSHVSDWKEDEAEAYVEPVTKILDEACFVRAYRDGVLGPILEHVLEGKP